MPPKGKKKKAGEQSQGEVAVVASVPVTDDANEVVGPASHESDSPVASSSASSPGHPARSDSFSSVSGRIVRVHVQSLMSDAMHSEPSNAPVLAESALAPQVFGQPDDDTLGPAPGPTVEQTTQSATTTSQNGEHIPAAISSNTASSSAAASSSATVTPAPLAAPIVTASANNPNASALAAALSNILKQVQVRHWHAAAVCRSLMSSSQYSHFISCAR
jgi:hypothetical protein